MKQLSAKTCLHSNLLCAGSDTKMYSLTHIGWIVKRVSVHIVQSHVTLVNVK